MIRVLIADDHQIVRQGLRQIVSEVEDLEVVGEATNGDEAVDAAKAGGFDVLVLDVSMPGRNGISALGEIRRSAPGTKVLVLTIHSEEAFAIRALESGAAGYMTKASAADDLVDAIRAVAKGDRYVSQDVATRLDGIGVGRRAIPPHARLSPREHEIMTLLAGGKSVRNIAEMLGRSIKTIHTHRYRIFEKLGVRSNSELTRYALKAGIVD